MNKVKLLISIFFVFLSITFVVAQNSNVAIDGATDKASDGAKYGYKEDEPPANSTVRGRVFYADTGRPVRRSNISLMVVENKGGGGEFSGLTDNNGYFEIKKVQVGTYYAFVNAPGVVSPLAYINFAVKRADTDMSKVVEGFDPIIVNGISDIDVQVPAIRGGAINGRITYADGDMAIGVKVEILREVDGIFTMPIPNMSSLMSMSLGNSGVFQTDDRGIFRFSGLPAGDYIVRVTEQISHNDGNRSSRYDPFGIMFMGKSSLLKIYYPDAFEVKNAQLVKVTLGQELYDINITIPDQTLYRIEGRVISKSDKLPISGTKIKLKRKYDNTFSVFDDIGRSELGATTDEQGNWVLKNVPKGTYTAVIDATLSKLNKNKSGYLGGDEVYSTNLITNSEPRVKNITKSFAKTVKEIIILDESLSDVVIELGIGGTISGKVTVGGDKGFPASVNLSASAEDEESFGDDYVGVSETKDVDDKEIKSVKKNFKLGQLPADIKMYFHATINSNEAFYVKSVTQKGRDMLAEPFELTEGEKLTNVVVVLGTDVATIKGKVLDENDNPVSPTWLLLVPTDSVKKRNSSYYRTVKTDKNGEFEAKVAPYEYAIIFSKSGNRYKTYQEFYAWLDEMFKDAQKINLEVGDTETIEIIKALDEN